MSFFTKDFKKDFEFDVKSPFSFVFFVNSAVKVRFCGGGGGGGIKFEFF